MAERTHDLVITYLVDQNGRAVNRAELDEALRNAYRVIEVICTPMANGLYVTVVLTHDDYEPAYGERPTD